MAVVEAAVHEAVLQPVMVKLPRGKGHVAYWSKVDGEWKDTDFRRPIQITSDGPTEITVAPVH